MRRLASWYHVAGIPHREEPQPVDRLEVSNSLSIAESAGPWLVLRLIIAASTRPGVHLVKHGKNSRVVANAVKKIIDIIRYLMA